MKGTSVAAQRSRFIRVVGLFLIGCSTFGLSGCGGAKAAGGGGTPPPSGITVVVSPTSAQLQPGGTFAFESIVTGASNTGVSWTASGGSVQGASSQGIYTAPATPGTYTVRAASVADSRAQGSATITVNAAVQPARVRLIGNIQDGEFSQLKTILEQKGFIVNASPGITAVPVEDVLMIHDTIALSPVVNEEQICQNTLAANKGLVWLGRGLGGSGTSNYDTSGIFAWLGAQRIDADFFTSNLFTMPSAGPYPLPAGIAPGAKAGRKGGGEDDWAIAAGRIAPTAVPILVNDPANISFICAYAFTPPTGGRVYFQFHPYGFETNTRSQTILMLMAGTRWASAR